MSKTKTKTKRKTKKSTKKIDKVYKRGDLGKAIYELFRKSGVDSVLYQECLDLAKSIMPNTKFNKYHFSWYKNKFRQMTD